MMSVLFGEGEPPGEPRLYVAPTSLALPRSGNAVDYRSSTRFEIINSMHGPVAIILAAGQGKRMRSETKVLHEVCGQPMIRYVVNAAQGTGAKTIVVVVGYAADQIREYLKNEPDVVFATQTEQLGTGHAVKICRELLAGYRPRARFGRRRAAVAPRAAGRSVRASESGRGGLLVGYRRHGRSDGLRTNPPRLGGPVPPYGRGARLYAEERALREVNPSCYVFELPGLWDALDQLGTGNAQGEYYLTDAPEYLKNMGRKVRPLTYCRC